MRLLPGVLFGSAVLAGFGLLQAVAAQPASPASPTTAAAALAAGSPEWIVDRFFVQKEFPELARCATGEFAELYKSSPTLGSIVPAAVTVAIRPLERDAAHAIFNVSMTDSNVSKEWYAYLRSEGGAFKLEAIRTLTLGARFFETLVAAEKGAVAGRLSELGVQELDRSHLTIASDAEVKAHFIFQKPLFEALAKDFAALVIGGDGANQVGYLHAPPGARVPKMSPQSFFYVEAITSGWYLFKTV